MTDRRRALRSLLFAPGNHARRVEKALSLQADAIILDLEDACPIAEKSEARAAVAAALQLRRHDVAYVRINALSTEWAQEDLAAVAIPGLYGIMLPKVETPDQLQTVDRLLLQLERDRGLSVGSIDLLPLVETARGFSRLKDIAGSCTRIHCLSFGAADLALDMAMWVSDEETELLCFRSSLVLASRAAGLDPPLDTAWLRVDDPAGFRSSANRARALGFQGKLCIHPDQVSLANELFTHSAEQIAYARRVVGAFAEADARGSAAIQLDGRLIDLPVAERARRILSQQDT